MFPRSVLHNTFSIITNRSRLTTPATNPTLISSIALPIPPIPSPPSIPASSPSALILALTSPKSSKLPIEFLRFNNAIDPDDLLLAPVSARTCTSCPCVRIYFPYFNSCYFAFSSLLIFLYTFNLISKKKLHPHSRFGYLATPTPTPTTISSFLPT
ncbi:hypothetical protein AX774_g2438 [Zancudomyces culisetae]|uniref:Uncharacterized protein n=1 Tax=Zancudomyces culisetae TaxID=1213189 RepID=A0A1R1PSV0_ZANCU|nr:hypothetical protein AX774_g2438 [Zancudomyces culisetae]|eukprot:OMH84038.1 hypothetical protein AX774_g2438 [Zancudomyces culisetae]